MLRNSKIVPIGSIIFALGLFSAASPTLAADGKAFFKGKTATWMIGSAPGGGHDFYGRLIAKHMEKALPGLTIVTINRPGAGHIIAANLIYAAKPDGLTWGSFTTALIYSQVQKKKGIRFDLAKMSWVGKAASDFRVMTIAKTGKYKSFQEVLDSKRPVKFSASGVGAGSYNDSYMTAKVFNIPQKIIVGYSGGEAILGLMRGETDVLQGGMSSAEQYVRAGQAKIILQFGNKLKGIPNGIELAKTPLQKALAKMMVNQGKLARISAGPPNIPPDRLATLRKAYMEAVNSKALRADAAKAKRELDPLPGDKVLKGVLAILNQPPEILALLASSKTAKYEKAKIKLVKHTGPVTKIKRGGRRVFISHGGQEVGAKISGSRTKITVGGSEAKRKAIKVGMTCTFKYPRPGAEAKNVDCK